MTARKASSPRLISHRSTSPISRCVRPRTRSSSPRADGEIEGGGKVDLSGKQGLDGDRVLDLQADFDGVPVGPFLPKDWRARLHGAAGGNVHVTGSGHDQARHATGHLELRDGELTALPVLDELATFTSSERYRQAPLQKARMDFDWQDNHLTVTNLVVESEGLLRLEGGFTVRDSQMDGTIQVGVARSALRWLSVVGTQVFNQPERDGYVWTTVKLTGPVNQPTEDLTPRLVMALQDAALKKAQQGANGVLDTAKSLLGFAALNRGKNYRVLRSSCICSKQANLAHEINFVLSSREIFC